jgi:hypothetical protein
MITKRKRNVKNKTKKISHKFPKISSNFDSGSIKKYQLKIQEKFPILTYLSKKK